MKYRVRHATTHAYSTTVLVSQQAARLRPRDSGRQRCLKTRLMIEPGPGERHDMVDYFGNHVVHFTVQTPHRTMTVTADSMVEVDAAARVEAAATPAWEELRDDLRRPNSPEMLRVAEFLYDSPYVQTSDAVTAFAAPSFAPERPALEVALDLSRRIHTDFAFDSAATALDTPLAEVLEIRRGVCQDFAHLMIAAARSHGLAARYVSGYLLTKPPPGKPRLVGADASHAWASVWIPEIGWIDIDPTNDVLVGDEHIVCAVGRDYEDVSPIKGVVVGGGEHALRVGVDVAPDI